MSVPRCCCCCSNSLSSSSFRVLLFVVCRCCRCCRCRNFCRCCRCCSCCQCCWCRNFCRCCRCCYIWLLSSSASDDSRFTSRLRDLHLPDAHHLPSSGCPPCWINCFLGSCLFLLGRNCCLNLMSVLRCCCCCSNSTSSSSFVVLLFVFVVVAFCGLWFCCLRPAICSCCFLWFVIVIVIVAVVVDAVAVAVVLVFPSPHPTPPLSAGAVVANSRWGLPSLQQSVL